MKNNLLGVHNRSNARAIWRKVKYKIQASHIRPWLRYYDYFGIVRRSKNIRHFVPKSLTSHKHGRAMELKQIYNLIAVATIRHKLSRNKPMPRTMRRTMPRTMPKYMSRWASFHFTFGTCTQNEKINQFRRDIRSECHAFRQELGAVEEELLKANGRRIILSDQDSTRSVQWRKTAWISKKIVTAQGDRKSTMEIDMKFLIQADIDRNRPF
jgi:hypothetical protein